MFRPYMAIIRFFDKKPDDGHIRPKHVVLTIQ